MWRSARRQARRSSDGSRHGFRWARLSSCASPRRLLCTGVETPERLFAAAEASFPKWEVVKDVVDEFIDISLNYRQSGHPGGSRSKVHLLLSLMLSGAMRWDVLHPWRPFGDRFVLSAGHTVPLIYATLATLNEAMRLGHERTRDPRFAFPHDGKFALTWEDLLG